MKNFRCVLILIFLGELYGLETINNNSEKKSLFNSLLISNTEKRDISDSSNTNHKHAELLEKIIRYGLNQSQYLINVQEKMLYEHGIKLNKTEPAHFLSVFNKQKKQAKNLSKYAYATLHASSLLSEQFMLTRKQVLYGLERVELRTSSIFDECPLDLNNKKSRQNLCSGFSLLFRTPSGQCNNLKQPSWGSSFIPFLRFLPPDYSDGIEDFRRSVSNGPLPNPRIISKIIHRDEIKNTHQFTMMVMQWGQFLDHDMTSTPTTRGFNQSVLKCCSDKNLFLPSEFLHPDCKPIEIPVDDPFYSKHNVTCMEFVRSSPGPRRDCSLGPRDQINQITSFIDASNIYGSTMEIQHNLRLLSQGMLKYTDLHIRKPLLPPLDKKAAEEECRIRTPNLHCFHAGDDRVNEQPGLATIHTLWLREHNRVALLLGKINPHWSDDRIYLEAKRFVAAVVQHITYNEWLPIVLGHRVLDIFELKLQSNGYYKEYNGSVNPTIANAFGAAAFRFGHSLVKNSISRCNKQFRRVPFFVELHKEMNNPSNLHNFGSVDRILLGLCNDQLARRDEFISEELTNHLFQTPRSGFGMDLAALNIQRGRDHGLAPYNIWREQCGLKRFRVWEEMDKVMEKDTVTRLMNVYEHVDDVDLFTGGMAEKPVVGGIVGPTFACIIGQQFLNLRKGDRFWYENGNHPGAFSIKQLQQIRKTSLSRVVCDCLDDVDRLQPFVFLQPDQFVNIRTVCKGEGLQEISLEPWREVVDDQLTQFNSNLIGETLQKNVTLQSKTKESSETPGRPNFSFDNENFFDKENIQLIEDDIKDINKPKIELEYDIKYNKELPRQLSPDQYYELNWALEEGRQELKPNKQKKKK